MDSNKQLRLLGQSAMLEEARTPYLIRLTMLIVCLVVLAFICWAAVSRIKEVARTVGEIVPAGQVQVVQHLEGGIVESIAVEDDQLVEAGEVLLVIEGEDIKAEISRLSMRQKLLGQRRDRLQRYLEATAGAGDEGQKVEIAAGQRRILEGMLQAHRTEKSVIEQQIAQKSDQIALLGEERQTEQKNLEIAEASFKTQEQLYQERLVPEYVYLNALQEVNNRRGRLAAIEVEIRQAEQAVREYRWRLQAIASTSREQALQELGLIEDEIVENEIILERLRKQVERLEVRSPVRGVVKGLEVHTRGGVVAPGQKLMEIVPLDIELVAEVRIQPVDIGHIQIGSPVNVKITAYDPSRYGSIDGTITGLSATTFAEPQGSPYYKGLIRLSQNFVGEQPGRNRIMPGMIVNADIITGEKSILAYLLKPIHLSMQSAFGER